MVFTVPYESTDEIQSMFKLLEDGDDGDIKLDDDYQNETDSLIKQLKDIVQDTGISHSTLEEVFMKVTGKKVQKYDRDGKRKVKGESLYLGTNKVDDGINLN
jgi:AraC-like DNA-binding protein